MGHNLTNNIAIIGMLKKNLLYKEKIMTILPTLALRSFVGFDNLFNELESISNQKQSSFPAHDIVRISDDEYEITLAVSGFNKKDINVSVENGMLTIESKEDEKSKNDKKPLEFHVQDNDDMEFLVNDSVVIVAIS